MVAIKRATAEMEFNPTSDSVILAGDTLIALGESSHLKILEEMIGVNNSAMSRARSE